jgi:hypothetical protein
VSHGALSVTEFERKLAKIENAVIALDQFYSGPLAMMAVNFG